MNFRKNFTALTGVICILFAFIFAFSSCGKEQQKEVLQEATNTIKSEGIYKKVITLSDMEGESTVELQVSSDNEDMLDRYDENSFILKVAKDGEKSFEATAEEPNYEEIEDDNVYDSMNEVHIHIVKESLAEGVVAYNLEITEDARWSGARWIHGWSVNRGVEVYDGYYCTNFSFYYWVTGTRYYWGSGSVCNGASFGCKASCCATSIYVSSGYNYSYWFY